MPNSGIRLLSLDALRGVDAMNHPRRWQGKAVEQTREIRPVQAGLVGAAIEPFVPAPRDFVEALGSTRREVPALTKQHIPARPEVVAAAAAEVAEAFRMDGKTAAAGPD